MILSQTLNAFKQRSFQVLATVVLYVLFASSFPLIAHQLFYTISLFIKDSLLWIMPLTVCFFIAHTVQSFERRAPLFVIVLLVFEAFSNFSSVWYAYFSAHSVADFLPPFQSTAVESDFKALWRLQITRPTWWSADKGALLGLALGGIGAFDMNAPLKNIVNQGKRVMEWVLTRGFARLIPLYIIGFAAQMYQTKILDHVFNYYGITVVWLTLFLTIYMIFLFMLGAGGSLHLAIRNIKSLLPVGFIAFTSGCSLSTMPWTIEGAAKTLRNPELAKVLIPATTNIQQIGDCIVNTFLCFLIYKNFYGTCPDIMTWVQFSIVFTLARFATAGFQGGAIFVMLPIYEAYLNFNGEMIALILALNVILDPLVTCCNVLANGALCRTYEKVWHHAQALIRKPEPGEVKI